MSFFRTTRRFLRTTRRTDRLQPVGAWGAWKRVGARDDGSELEAARVMSYGGGKNSKKLRIL